MLKTRISLLLIIAALMVAMPSTTNAEAMISIDHVDGLDANGMIPEGGTLTYYLRFTGDENPHRAMSNGFRVYSDNLNWTGVTLEVSDTYAPWIYCYTNPCWFDMGFWIVYYGVDGMGADTMGIGALVGEFGTGLPVGFDDVLLEVTVGPVTGPGGSFLNFDSSFYPPAGYWLWDIVEDDLAWGGASRLMLNPGTSYIYYEPDPLIVKSYDEPVIWFYFWEPRINDIDLSSIQLDGKFTSYLEGYPRIEDGQIVTNFHLLRFLSQYRPISGSFETTYQISYDYIDGGSNALTGDMSILLYPGDVNLDGVADIQDLQLMVNMLWAKGESPEFEELADIDHNGRVDVLDLRALVDIVY